jgi:hypothetical protein
MQLRHVRDVAAQDRLFHGQLADQVVGHQIGTAMHLVPGGDAQQAGDTIAEAAYTYAAGHPSTQTAIRYGRSFTWTCTACDKSISDRGLCNGPADDEYGHDRNCPRLEATIAEWHAQWEAGQ